MKVSDLGEHGTIDLLARTINSARDVAAPSWQKLVLGIGDDCAAWQGDGPIQLATVDALRQDVHFTLETTSWNDLGWKALAVNLSDIAAMGGLPAYALVSLAIPEQTDIEDILAFYRGMLELAGHFGVAIVGGDIDRTPYIDATVTVFGNAGGSLLTRSAAKIGDKVAVTGFLGGAAAGLEMLSKNLKLDAESSDALKKAFSRPAPRIEEGQIMVIEGVRAAIDVSDGLVADLGHICRASGVSAIIRTDRVPVQATVKTHFGSRALEMALTGGEDYELLFTADGETIERIKDHASCQVTVIGEIIEDAGAGVRVVDSNGQIVDLPQTGWDHFQEK
ncbi:MAG: thiamine-phosphate kinase [Chloroflexi bacterium]|nr:thiamine-phosphate kinase [Chloroflexota bacterium]